jgi:hypothetical protein
MTHRRPCSEATRQNGQPSWAVFRSSRKHGYSTRSLDVSSYRRTVLFALGVSFPSCVCRAGILRARSRGAGLIADGSVLKCNADEIALPPDHAALANGVELVKAQFEIQRQQIEGVQFNASAGIGHVLNAAREDPALRVKE